MNMPSRSRLTHRLAATALALVASATVRANPELAEQKNCLACHAVDHKLMGPSFKDVSARYAGQRDAPDKLAQKIVKGGGGVWGALPMPANPQVSDAEAHLLVVWILQLR